MRAAFAVILLAAVQLGGSFGEAEASTVTLGTTTMVIDLRVEIQTSAQAVVAHLSSGDETMVVSLLPRETAGTFGIRTELPRKNWIVVFEILGPTPALSDPASLGFLGAVLELDEPEPEPEPEEESDGWLSPETRKWGFLGLALTAGSLSLLALWVLGGRKKEQGTTEEE